MPRNTPRITGNKILPECRPLLESLPDAVAIVDAGGQILDANHLFASMFGRTPVDCARTAIADLVSHRWNSADFGAHLEKACAAVFENGIGSTLEDEPCGWTISINPVRSQPDAIDGLLLVFREMPRHMDDSNRLRTKLSLALQAAHAGIWEWNPKTNEVEHSEEVNALLGLEDGRIRPTWESWMNAIFPEDRENISLAVAEACERQEHIDMEYRIVHPDGSVRWVMSRGMPLFDQNGLLTVYVGTIIDITDRKQLENELLESKIRFSHALDAAHAGIWEWDVANDQLIWSEQLWPLYGLKANDRELNHQLCVDTIHPDDRAMVSGIIKSALENLDGAHIEYRTCHPDGSVHWLTSRGMPLRDENGVVIRYIGTVIDITERKQIELELIENRNRLGQALEAARAGVWEWNVETGENIWSAEIWPLYGLEAEHGRKPSFELWAESIHPEDRDMAIKAVSDAAAARAELNVEYRVRYRNGSVHWLMSRGRPIPDKSGGLRFIGTIIDITGRKAVESALNENRIRFDFALEATKAGVWQWDIPTDKITWSEQVWRLYGLEPFSAEPSHRLCESNIHPDDWGMSFETIMHAVNQDTDFTIEYRVCHPDGSIHWLVCRGVPMHGTDDHAPCYIGTIMDITQRKQAEDALRKSQAKLDFVLEKTHIGFWDFDLQKNTIQRSLEHERIFGYDAIMPDWSMAKFLTHVHPDHRDRVTKLIERVRENKEDYAFECPILTAGGELRWIWIFGTLDIDGNGEVRHLTGLIRDITDKKAIELQLLESEQKFRNIFEASPVAISIVSPETGIVYDVNTAWLRTFGYSREDVLRGSVTSFGLYARPEDHQTIVRELREQGRLFNRPFRFRKKSGEVMNILFSAEFMVANGRTDLLVMLTDITVQEQLQTNISVLENAVAERTLQLQQEIIRLQRFLSMISHEYRTPLAIIRGNLDLIELKQKSGNQVNTAETSKIKRAIDRLVEVLEVSIQESRIIESKKTAPAVTFPVEEVIESQQESFSAMWPERNVHRNGNLGASEIIGEPPQLKIAIFNLLDNARKYSPPDSSIEMGCSVENGEAVITISNESTTSINAGDNEAMFEKYRRGGNAMNTGGAGLGLWLVRNIIDQHHGNVRIESIGSTVKATVRLPLTDKAAWK